MAQPGRAKPGGDRDADVGPRQHQITGRGEAEGLEAEHRKGRKAAADAGHDELPLAGTCVEAPTWRRQRCIEADGEGAGDVYEKRAPGKARAERGKSSDRCERAENAADGGAERDDAIEGENVLQLRTLRVAGRVDCGCGSD